MKIPEFKVDVDKSANFIERSFGVGNVGFILNILRDKLYSNIIESACREYSCNARDAHREIGTPDRPIEIHLPNDFESNYKIKDFGIGISPERMSEVFLQYGNSTKRNDNSQIGGFGLGGKIFFGYASQFTIITICEEIQNNITVNVKRTYIAFIDSTQEGRINLISEEIAEEHTGTEIICPIEDKDVDAFIAGTIKTTQYWPIKPLLFGRSPLPEYPKILGELLAEGDDWKIYNNKRIYSINSNSVKSLVIIDGIQYIINENFINDNDRWILNNNLHLFFNIGELTLSASRESLQYDDNTVKLIKNKIHKIQKELSAQFNTILNQKETYEEAVEFYDFFSTSFSKIIKKSNYTWNGYKITGKMIVISTAVLTNFATINSYFKTTNKNKTSIKTLSDYKGKIEVSKNVKYYYNDINPDHIFRNKIIKTLELGKTTTVINYKKDKTYDDFVIDIKKKYAQLRLETDNSFIFDLIRPIPLSSVIEDKLPKLIKPAKPKNIKNNKISGYLYTRGSKHKTRSNFKNQDLNKDDAEYYIEINFAVNSIKTKTLKGDIWNFNNLDLFEIQRMLPDNKIYAIKEKDISKLGKSWKPLSILLENLYNTIDESYIKSLTIASISRSGNKNYNLYNLSKLIEYESNIIHSNSLIIKYFSFAKHVNNIDNFNFNTLNKIGGFLNKTIDKYKIEMQDFIFEMKTRYPLIESLYSLEEYDYEHIIDYINMCDDKYAKLQTKLKLVKG